MMLNLGRIWSVMVLGCALCVSFLTHAGEATTADAQLLTEKAATYLQAHGKDQLIAEVNKKGGQFNPGGGELYVFIYDMTGTILAHPVNPALIGKNPVNVPDVNGKFYRKDIIDIAKTKGSGWVDYMYRNPVSGKTEPKTAYVLKADDLILIAGVYLKKN